MLQKKKDSALATTLVGVVKDAAEQPNSTLASTFRKVLHDAVKNPNLNLATTLAETLTNPVTDKLAGRDAFKTDVAAKLTALDEGKHNSFAKEVAKKVAEASQKATNSAQTSDNKLVYVNFNAAAANQTAVTIGVIAALRQVPEFRAELISYVVKNNPSDLFDALARLAKEEDLLMAMMTQWQLLKQCSTWHRWLSSTCLSAVALLCTFSIWPGVLPALEHGMQDAANGYMESMENKLEDMERTLNDVGAELQKVTKAKAEMATKVELTQTMSTNVELRRTLEKVASDARNDDLTVGTICLFTAGFFTLLAFALSAHRG